MKKVAIVLLWLFAIYPIFFAIQDKDYEILWGVLYMLLFVSVVSAILFSGKNKKPKETLVYKLLLPFAGVMRAWISMSEKKAVTKENYNTFETEDDALITPKDMQLRLRKLWILGISLALVLGVIVGARDYLPFPISNLGKFIYNVYAE
jgi:hypothetical protein